MDVNTLQPVQLTTVRAGRWPRARGGSTLCVRLCPASSSDARRPPHLPHARVVAIYVAPTARVVVPLASLASLLWLPFRVAVGHDEGGTTRGGGGRRARRRRRARGETTRAGGGAPRRRRDDGAGVRRRGARPSASAGHPSLLTFFESALPRGVAWVPNGAF